MSIHTITMYRTIYRRDHWNRRGTCQTDAGNWADRGGTCLSAMIHRDSTSMQRHSFRQRSRILLICTPAYRETILTISTSHAGTHVRVQARSCVYASLTRVRIAKDSGSSKTPFSQNIYRRCHTFIETIECTQLTPTSIRLYCKGLIARRSEKCQEWMALQPLPWVTEPDRRRPP